MLYVFFNLDGSELTGIGGSRPLSELVDNISEAFGKKRNEYAVFTVPDGWTRPLGPRLADIDITNPAEPVADNVRTDTAARLEIEKGKRKAVATLHGLRYANTTNDPLTGAPISTANDADTIRRHTWTAEQYWKAADGLTQEQINAQWPNANANAHADITTVRALQDTLRGVTLTIHAEIDAVTEQANLPSESDITTDPRWPTP